MPPLGLCWVGSIHQSTGGREQLGKERKAGRGKKGREGGRKEEGTEAGREEERWRESRKVVTTDAFKEV